MSARTVQLRRGSTAPSVWSSVPAFGRTTTSGDNLGAMPARFVRVAMTASGAGLLLLLCAKPIRKLMAGVQ